LEFTQMPHPRPLLSAKDITFHQTKSAWYCSRAAAW